MKGCMAADVTAVLQNNFPKKILGKFLEQTKMFFIYLINAMLH